MIEDVLTCTRAWGCLLLLELAGGEVLSVLLPHRSSSIFLSQTLAWLVRDAGCFAWLDGRRRLVHRSLVGMVLCGVAEAWASITSS